MVFRVGTLLRQFQLLARLIGLSLLRACIVRLGYFAWALADNYFGKRLKLSLDIFTLVGLLYFRQISFRSVANFLLQWLCNLRAAFLVVRSPRLLV